MASRDDRRGSRHIVGGPAIEAVDVSAYRIPTDGPESDGTIEWGATTLVLVELEADGRRGLGWTYTDRTAAGLIRGVLAPLLVDKPAFAIARIGASLVGAVRNLGRPGLATDAISAIDVALWDLKARILGLPLANLLGRFREEVPVYGSGGFTSYSVERLCEQLGGWAAEGMGAVKMKVGREPRADPARVRAAREAIGPGTELFVDGNGAYHQREAIALAEIFAGDGVSWFEEPVPSHDTEGLRFIRERLPGGMRMAAGEYCNGSRDFLRLLIPGAVDVLQADATRCGGISGFLQAGTLCEAWNLPLSAHTAPSIHLHACAAVHCDLAPLEYFHDHVRIEGLLFEGTRVPQRGALRPDESSPGLGMKPRRGEMERFRIE